MTLPELSALAAAATKQAGDLCCCRGEYVCPLCTSAVAASRKLSNACSPEVIAALCRVAEAAKVLLVTTGGQIVDDGGVRVGTAMARDRLITALSALESVRR